MIDLIKNVPHCDESTFAAIKSWSAPVALFGAGEVAWYTLAYLRSRGIQPVCICDNDVAKQGTRLLGVPVCSYGTFTANSSLHNGRYSIVLSIGPMHTDAIQAQLARAGEKNPTWLVRGYEMCGEKITHRYVQEHAREFEASYALLCDERSRGVFVNVLNAKLTGEFHLYEEIQSSREFFDPDVVALTDREVLLDVGAYTGNVTIEFSRQTRSKHDGIIAMEPNRRTFATLLSNLARNNIQGVETHNKGAWSSQALLHFQDERDASSRLSESAGTGPQESSIEVDTIDNLLHGRRVTYITMDIEGAEHNAVLGAEQTIRRWRPKIAVCVYHRREDMFDLPLLLKSFVPEYRFFMRHYTDNQTETVLYAV